MPKPAKEMPEPKITRYVVIAFVLLVILTLSLFGLRGRKSAKPPLEIFPDMDRQAKFHPQAESAFFADGRTDRLPIPGTVPYIPVRQDEYPIQKPMDVYEPDSYVATGKKGEAFGTGIPFAVDHELMRLGQAKFNLLCSMCHGLSGDGNGVTKNPRYGMVATPTYHDDRLRNMPDGEIYNTITNGKNNMNPYGAKLSHEERWAVVLYLRALQRAQNATAEDAPTEQYGELGI